MTNDTFPVEVFSTGHWLNRDWSEADLDEIARNYSLLKEYIKPPAKLGHSEKQVLAQKDGQPALGRVVGVRRVGKKLVADFADMPAAFREIVKGGKYSRVSVELYPMIERTPFARNLPVKTTGKVLSAVAFLGADVPECKTLEDLGRFLAVEQPLAFAEPAPGTVTCVLGAARRTPTKEIEDQVRASVEAALEPVRDEMDRQLAEHHARWTKEIEMTTKNNFTASDIAAWPERDLHRGAVEELLDVLQIKPTDAARVAVVRAAVAGMRPDLDVTKPGLLERLMKSFDDYRADKPPMNPPGEKVSVPEGKAYGDSYPALHRPGVPNTSQNVTKGRHQTDTAAHDALNARFKEAAEAEGVADISKATPQQRDRIGSRVAAAAPADVPLFGPHAQEAARLGGRDRYDLLRHVARTHKLDLDRASERRFAEQLLWNAIGASVETATTFDQALHAVCTSEKLSFTESADRARAVKLLAARRPDLVTVYGRGTVVDDRPQAFSEDVGLDEDAKAVKFEEAIVDYLIAHDLADVPEHRGAATRHVSMKRPGLRPSYGSEGGR